MPLTRTRHLMPDDVRTAIEARNLVAAYAGRPAYQRNDYLGWIQRAARAETRRKRLAQMLDELEDGTRYMNMGWRPQAKA